MLRALKAYPALLRAYWARAIEYRFQMIIWFLVGTYPLAMMAVWLKIAQGQGGSVGGYTISEFIGYYLGVTWVRRITYVWILDDIEDGTRKGELSAYLLRPLGFVHHLLTRVTASRLMQSVVSGSIVCLVVLLVPGQQFYLLNPITLLLFVMALVVGFLFEFILQYAVGASSFYTTQFYRIFDIFFFLKSFFGGFVVPLGMLPPAIATLANWLPFSSSMGLPVEILIGKLTPADALTRILISAVWVFGIALLSRWLWRVGVRAYSAVGA
jgi:ABC-2 type transport system permease protein